MRLFKDDIAQMAELEAIFDDNMIDLWWWSIEKMLHPGFEFKVMEHGRKDGVSYVKEMEAEGWIYIGWDRFDYTEEEYYCRPKDSYKIPPWCDLPYYKQERDPGPGPFPDPDPPPPGVHGAWSGWRRWVEDPAKYLGMWVLTHPEHGFIAASTELGSAMVAAKESGHENHTLMCEKINTDWPSYLPDDDPRVPVDENGKRIYYIGVEPK